MQDAAVALAPKLNDLNQDDWFAAMARLGRQYGYFTDLGENHSALFVDEGETLLVTFEQVDDIRAEGRRNEPLDFELVRATGWSLLVIMAKDDTWFRDEALYAYFDTLSDDGFFDEFDRVVFYGRGMCGYAAASFSAANPGSAVVALQPIATLDPRITGWDKRHQNRRRLNFNDRYGYAPDMIDAASDVYVFFDPKNAADAAHAALFNKPHTTLVPVPRSSGDMEVDFLEMKVLYRLLARIGMDPLESEGIARTLRARRTHAPYLRRMLKGVEQDGNPVRSAKLARAILQVMRMPVARKRLARSMEDGVELPAPLKPEA